MNYSFFIPKDTPDKIRTIFNYKSDKTAFDKRVDVAKSRLFNSDWSSFEDVYFSIYTLLLSGDANWSSSKKPTVPSISFQTLLDLELADRENEYGAPDQFAVFDLIRLRERLLELFPAGSQMNEIGVGCALLGFSIPLAESYNAGDAGRKEFERDLKGYLLDNGWESLEHRFKVADYHPK